jgi:hypothetical protein
MNGGPPSDARAFANQERLTFRNAAASLGSSSTSLNSMAFPMAKLLFESPLLRRAVFLLRSGIAPSEIHIRREGAAAPELHEKLEWS